MRLPKPALDLTWIVVPAYQEGEAIRSVVEGLVSSYPKVVVVDDGSTDDTASQANRGGAVVLRHIVNRGQGAALQTGITHSLQAGAAYIVTFDSDGQHRVEDIKVLIEPILRGEAEVVLGSRFLGSTESMPAGRRLILKTAVLFTWAFSGLRLTDAHNGLRAFSRRAALGLEIRLDRMAHASELMDQVARLGLSYAEVPVHIRYTDYSQAKGQRPSAAFRVLLEYFMGRILG